MTNLATCCWVFHTTPVLASMPAQQAGPIMASDSAATVTERFMRLSNADASMTLESGPWLQLMISKALMKRLIWRLRIISARHG
jgi:hypothetical protein